MATGLLQKWLVGPEGAGHILSTYPWPGKPGQVKSDVPSNARMAYVAALTDRAAQTVSR